MPYDQDLAQRIREALEDHPGLTEKKMFGGLATSRFRNAGIGPKARSSRRAFGVFPHAPARRGTSIAHQDRGL